MKKFKQMIKAALLPALIAIIGIVVGAILALVGLATDNEGMLIAGAVLFIVGLISLFVMIRKLKDRARAICAHCQKFMGDADEDVEYSYQCVNYEAHKNTTGTGKQFFDFSYKCSIICPHCSYEQRFDYKVSAETMSMADYKTESYIKGILNLKK